MSHLNALCLPSSFPSSVCRYGWIPTLQFAASAAAASNVVFLHKPPSMREMSHSGTIPESLGLLWPPMAPLPIPDFKKDNWTLHHTPRLRPCSCSRMDSTSSYLMDPHLHMYRYSRVPYPPNHSSKAPALVQEPTQPMFSTLAERQGSWAGLLGLHLLPVCSFLPSPWPPRHFRKEHGSKLCQLQHAFTTDLTATKVAVLAFLFCSHPAQATQQQQQASAAATADDDQPHLHNTDTHDIVHPHSPMHPAWTLHKPPAPFSNEYATLRRQRRRLCRRHCRFSNERTRARAQILLAGRPGGRILASRVAAAK